MNYDDMQYRDWIRQAYEAASKSPDPSTHVGALIVIGNLAQTDTLSCNTLTPGIELTAEEWADKPTKYAFVEHAERGAIFKAAKNGLWLEGATLVGNWAACVDCARAIVCAGIKKLIRHSLVDITATPGWEKSVADGDRIMIAGGVEIITVTGPIEGAPKVLRGGEWFDPAA